uniref:Larval cuticle protein 5-like n=1 Tax=Stomoxys calcitrans TaxID=35570 RepID=A0A1I8NYB1_STOCA
MKFIILFAMLFAATLARPDAQILTLDSEVGPSSYRFASETSDGNKHTSEGHLENVGTEHESLAVRGSYSWVDEKTGEQFTVNYVADESGYHPSGAHLPVA